MEGFIGFILFLIGGAVIALAVVTALIARTSSGSLHKKTIATLGIVGAAIIALSLSIVIVNPGSVGVITALGSVQEETLSPGIHLRIPIVNSVKTFETRIQAHNFQDLEAASKENLALKVTGTMNYHIDGSKASLLYQTLSDDFAAKVIDPAFADYIKQVVPAYSADSTSPNWVLAHRDDIRLATKTALNDNLARYHIIVDDIYIANIGNPDDYEAAIRARQIAQQQVATEQQVTEQIKQKALQAKEQAIGEASALRERATGQADANKKLTESLTPELIQYTMIQKLSDKIQIMLLPAGQQFLLDPKAILTPPAN